MTRLIAATMLSICLVVWSYVAFWWGSTFIYGNQVRTSVEQALGGHFTYDMPKIVPDLQSIKVSLPNVRLQLRDSPIMEVRASDVLLTSGLFSRNQWILQLPPRVELVMASGDVFVMETHRASLVWNVEPAQLSLRAGDLTLTSMDRERIVHVADVMVERSSTDNGLRLNLASRPDFGNGASVLSGEAIIPYAVVNDLMEALAKIHAPSLAAMVRVGAASMSENHNSLRMNNISFISGDVSGAVYGTLQINPQGQFQGQISLTAESPSRLLGWLKMINSGGGQTPAQQRAWQEMERRLDSNRPVARLEVIPNGLLINGYLVGPIPLAQQVIAAIWP